MKFNTIYTISPLILSESLPKTTSVAYVISEYFHLFNIYSTNPYLVREYMNFIDINFDFAFSKLKYKIISYDYPSDIEDINDALKYINEKYGLIDTMYEIDRCYQANHYKVRDILNDKVIDIYFNDYASYDLSFLNHGVGDDEEDIVSDLLKEITYLKNKNDIDIFKILLGMLDEYKIAVSDYINNSPEFYNSGMISEPLLILSQLKSFVKDTIKEREELNNDNVYN